MNRVAFIAAKDDPYSKFDFALERSRREEIGVFTVDACDCGGINQVFTVVQALGMVNRPQWKLELCVSHNKLKYLPEPVWYLSNLEELRIDTNDLKIIPPDIAKLTKLKKLWIHNNPLEGFPEAVFQLEQLEVPIERAAGHLRLDAPSAGTRFSQQPL